MTEHALRKQDHGKRQRRASKEAPCRAGRNDAIDSLPSDQGGSDAKGQCDKFAKQEVLTIHNVTACYPIQRRNDSRGRPLNKRTQDHTRRNALQMENSVSGNCLKSMEPATPIGHVLDFVDPCSSTIVANT